MFRRSRVWRNKGIQDSNQIASSLRSAPIRWAPGHLLPFTADDRSSWDIRKQGWKSGCIRSGYSAATASAFGPGATSETDGRRLLRRIIYRPDSVTRVYIGPDYIVRETLFTPLEEAGAILRYEVEGKPVDIEVHFTPVLNLMWPGAIGGQFAEWNPELPGYVLAEPTHQISASIASTEIVTHDTTVNSALRTSGELAFSVRPHSRRAESQSVATIYVASLPKTPKIPAAAIRDLSAHRADMEAQAAKHYAELTRGALRIRTPDEDVNRALQWAEIALDQAWVCSPQLGCGMVAG